MMSTITPLDLAEIPIWDHHAHPLWHKTSIHSEADFRRWFSESTDVAIRSQHIEHSLFWRSSINWLAERLGCEPTSSAVWLARQAQPEAAWAQQLLSEAKIHTLLLDYGYGGPDAYNHVEMQQLLPTCRIEPMLRLETTAEQLMGEYPDFGQFVAAFRHTVEQARANGYLALKSIIAYRSGLAVSQPDRAQAAADFAHLQAETKRSGRLRLKQQALGDYLLHLALEAAQQQDLPVQFHTGFGDADADLRLVNPLHLRAVIEHYPQVPLVLLHAGWPYTRELAHLAAIYGNVWLDLSLAIPFATSGILSMLREILGMAPISKILFATDAFTLPEIYWLAARWGRWGLGQVLAEFVANRWLRAAQAEEAAVRILHGNAQQLYKL